MGLGHVMLLSTAHIHLGLHLLPSEYCISGPKLYGRGAHRPQGEPTTFILLNGHSAKLPSRFLSLCAILTPHQSTFFVQWIGLMQKLTISQSAESQCQWRGQSQMQRLYHTPSPRLRDHCRRSARKILRTISQVVENQSKTVSCGHSWTSVLMSSQQLCLSAQDLYDISPINNPPQGRGSF